MAVHVYSEELNSKDLRSNRVAGRDVEVLVRANGDRRHSPYVHVHGRKLTQGHVYHRQVCYIKSLNHYGVNVPDLAYMKRID